MEELFAPEPPGGIDDALGAGLGPRPPSMLFDAAAGLPLPPGPVLDAGCRDGAHARALAARLARPVIGVDLVAPNLVAGRRHPRAEARSFALADLVALPFAARSFALVWCRDTLELVADPAAALAEMARVLAPGGAVVLYTAWATEDLEPRERRRLFDALALTEAGADRAAVDAAVAASGLAVEHFELVSPEWAEHDLEQGGAGVVADLLALSRLRRDATALVARFGERAHEQALAFSQWGVYLVLGKLQTGLWVLRR